MILRELAGRVVGASGVEDLSDAIVDVVSVLTGSSIRLCLVVKHRLNDSA